MIQDGLGQSEVAKHFGVQKSTVSNWGNDYNKEHPISDNGISKLIIKFTGFRGSQCLTDVLGDIIAPTASLFAKLKPSLMEMFSLKRSLT